MTTSSPTQNLTRFEELVLETDLIATVKFKPAHFIQSNQLHFIASYDDLDFLTFAKVELPSGNRISLVQYQNSPDPGTEIRVALGLSSPSVVLAEALSVLNLSRDDLDWVHPHINLFDD
jgi:hypothetical protein